MTQPEIQVRDVPPHHVAQLVRFAPVMGPDVVGPIVGPMFGEVGSALEAAGVPVVGPPTGVYEVAAPDEPGEVRITVAFPVPDGTTHVDGLEVTTLRGIDRAAVTTFHGAPDGIGEAWQAYMGRLGAEGYDTTDHTREIYVSEPGVPEEDWDTLLVAELR